MEQPKVRVNGKTNLSCSKVGVLWRNGGREGFLWLLLWPLPRPLPWLLWPCCGLNDSKVGMVQAGLRSCAERGEHQLPLSNDRLAGAAHSADLPLHAGLPLHR